MADAGWLPVERKSGSVRWTEVAIVEALRGWVARYGEVPARVDWDRGMCRLRGHDGKLARLDAHPEPLPTPVPVLLRSGSWEAALAAAGFRARFTPQKISTQEQRRTVALYESGLSPGQVATRLGLDPKTVRERLDRAGIARRPPARRRTVLDQPQTAVVAAALAGAGVDELARRFALSTYAVRCVLERHDVGGGRRVRRIRAVLPNAAIALSKPEREIVELVIGQRLTQPEAAERLGIALHTVERRLKAVANLLDQPDARPTAQAIRMRAADAHGPALGKQDHSRQP